MLLTFLWAQLILAAGMLAYLAWRRLFRVRRWLPFAIGWNIIFWPVLVINVFFNNLNATFIALIPLMLSVLPSAIGMFFFFLPNEPNRSKTVAFWTLWPLAALFDVAAWLCLNHFKSTSLNSPDVNTLFLLVIMMISPNVAACALWAYHRFRPRAVE